MRRALPVQDSRLAGGRRGCHLDGQGVLAWRHGPGAAMTCETRGFLPDYPPTLEADQWKNSGITAARQADLAPL
jgi:hypothetical protein